jgi:hypothetical protein
MIARFFSREKLNLNVPRAVRRKYISELGGEGLMEIPKPVWQVLDNLFLCGLGLCCFSEEYIDVFIREASEVWRGITFIDEIMELDRETAFC